MLKREDFKFESEKIINWIDDYFRKINTFPVKSQASPGDIYNQLPDSIPADGDSIEEILKDTTDIILPGITHWQHPNFHGYFPANSSIESVFAEMITAAIGAQCMIWETSPAAAELEERMLEWMRDAMGIPKNWEGVIQDTASTATLVAVICAREKSTDFAANEDGVPPGLRVYCSTQTHSSIEKAVVIAGIGRKNLVKIEVDKQLRLSPSNLEDQIKKDLKQGLRPTCVIAAIGTTGTVAVDDIEAIASICNKYGIWLHIDAAYAGTALFLPEYQWMIRGIKEADSFVFNPHKWMFTNFDCTAYYVKDANHLIQTFEILPEYLKVSSRGKVNDYRDWGIPLGRRFRALKLWFVMRSFGLDGIRKTLRHHIELNQYFARQINERDSFHLMAEPFLNFSSIQFRPGDKNLSQEEINTYNQQLVQQVNTSGKAFLSHTVVDGNYIIRVVIGQTYVTKEDVDRLLEVLAESIQTRIS